MEGKNEELQQAMQELEIKLAKKSSLLKSYELALKATAQQLDQLADISERRLRIKDAADRLVNPGSTDSKCKFRSDVVIAAGGELCRILEMEITKLEETERQLMIRNNFLEGALSARDQRIAELEELVRRKDRVIEDNHSVVDAKERRIQKLRMKLSCSTRPTVVDSSDVHLQEQKGSSPPPPAAAAATATALSTLAQGQEDRSERNTFAPRGQNLPVTPSPLKESMRHAYEEAQAALQHNPNRRPKR